MLFSLSKYNISFRNIYNLIFYLKNEGIVRTGHRVVEFLTQVFFKDQLYDRWIQLHESNANDVICDYNDNVINISIVVPVYNCNIRYLSEMLESVRCQTYHHWELCIADGNSNDDVRSLLLAWQKNEPRARVIFLDENLGITGNSNAALSMAQGDFVAFLDHDDTLAPNALCELVKAITLHPDTDFIYSDEDKLTENSQKRFHPHFKPDWSPDTFRSYNYICHFTAIKRALLSDIGFFREGFEGSQDYDLFLRASERAVKIVHIPLILYHWRAIATSTSINPYSKSYAYDSGKNALTEHLVRMGTNGRVWSGATVNTYRITYELDNAKVSIIIPNKDHVSDLKRCINSILQKTKYANYEIIIIDNGSTQVELMNYYNKIISDDKIKVFNWYEEFNYSSINNYGASIADGSYLLFLNNDTEVVNQDWIDRMVEHAGRPEVGAVGAKLYYKDGSIQHAGIVVGINGMAGHAHRYFPMNSSGYMDRLKIIHNVSAVTGACLLVRTSVFNQVGGFDEAYQVAMGDVDLCMKIRACGFLIVWTPFAELYHYESSSRGADDSIEKQQRLEKEITRLNHLWDDIFRDGDPYYNRNLTLDKEDFSLRLYN